MDIHKLRLKNKQVLVNYAFSVFCRSKQNCQQTKDNWVAILVNGCDFLIFIDALKRYERILLETGDSADIDPASLFDHINLVDSNVTLVDMTVHEYDGGYLTRHAQSILSRIDVLDLDKVVECV